MPSADSPVQSSPVQVSGGGDSARPRSRWLAEVDGVRAWPAGGPGVLSAGARRSGGGGLGGPRAESSSLSVNGAGGPVEIRGKRVEEIATGLPAVLHWLEVAADVTADDDKCQLLGSGGGQGICSRLRVAAGGPGVVE